MSPCFSWLNGLWETIKMVGVTYIRQTAVICDVSFSSNSWSVKIIVSMHSLRYADIRTKLITVLLAYKQLNRWKKDKRQNSKTADQDFIERSRGSVSIPVYRNNSKGTGVYYCFKLYWLKVHYHQFFSVSEHSARRSTISTSELKCFKW